jgi:hypothetical protein
MRRAKHAAALLGLLHALVLPGCDEEPSATEADAASSAALNAHPAPDPAPEPEVVPPPALHDPVAMWKDGHVSGEVEAGAEGVLVIDLGDDWTPYIFSERASPSEEPVPNFYREIYLALARGEYPDNYHGQRAREDKYLELYGIPPTVTLMRTRFEEAAARACNAELDYEPLRSFEGFVAYESNHAAERNAARYVAGERTVKRLIERAEVTSVDELDLEALSTRDQRAVRDYQSLGPAYHAVRATQERLRCGGYLSQSARVVSGGLDWVTHEALAEFERRHRVFGWGFVGRDTLPVLQATPEEGERETVIRVLTERAIHAAGILEDGSQSKTHDGRQITYEGADGRQHPVRDLVSELEEKIIDAFGLETPESTLAFLRSLGDLDGHVRVAVPGIALPEYYSDDMPLSVELNRGDVWYDFPYDEEGNERAQPISRRPRITVYTEYLGHRIALARFGTTIGGWRSEVVDGTVMWAYKGSPTGERVWHRIVAAPVWVPPETTPARGLLTRRGGAGGPRFAVNVHEMGPSYASAYGLVAAYHQREYVREDGERTYGGDQGIRTHGSVDYMSIMRRHSHGCHRLHNHIAVRLMSFVLRHTPHRRKGQEPLTYGRRFEYEGKKYSFALEHGGYAYELERALPITVLPGRILGARTTPIDHPIPQYDREVGAYIMPDGQAVAVDRLGNLTPIPHPLAGMDAGVPAAPPVNANSITPNAPALPSPPEAMQGETTSPRPAPTPPPTPVESTLTRTEPPPPPPAEGI